MKKQLNNHFIYDQCYLIEYGWNNLTLYSCWFIIYGGAVNFFVFCLNLCILHRNVNNCYLVYIAFILLCTHLIYKYGNTYIYLFLLLECYMHILTCILQEFVFKVWNQTTFKFYMQCNVKFFYFRINYNKSTANYMLTYYAQLYIYLYICMCIYFYIFWVQLAHIWGLQQLYLCMSVRNVIYKPVLQF